MLALLLGLWQVGHPPSDCHASGLATIILSLESFSSWSSTQKQGLYAISPPSFPHRLQVLSLLLPFAEVEVCQFHSASYKEHTCIATGSPAVGTT